MTCSFNAVVLPCSAPAYAGLRDVFIQSKQLPFRILLICTYFQKVTGLVSTMMPHLPSFIRRRAFGFMYQKQPAPSLCSSSHHPLILMGGDTWGHPSLRSPWAGPGLQQAGGSGGLSEALPPAGLRSPSSPCASILGSPLSLPAANRCPLGSFPVPLCHLPGSRHSDTRCPHLLRLPLKQTLSGREGRGGPQCPCSRPWRDLTELMSLSSVLPYPSIHPTDISGVPPRAGDCTG